MRSGAYAFRCSYIGLQRERYLRPFGVITEDLYGFHEETSLAVRVDYCRQLALFAGFQMA